MYLNYSPKRGLGDLGLTPRDVESKLDSAFQLAQAWDCVLLLDEADIFLAARTTTDLERNALVSGQPYICPTLPVQPTNWHPSFPPGSRVL